MSPTDIFPNPIGKATQQTFFLWFSTDVKIVALLTYTVKSVLLILLQFSKMLLITHLLLILTYFFSNINTTVFFLLNLLKDILLIIRLSLILIYIMKNYIFYEYFIESSFSLTKLREFQCQVLGFKNSKLCSINLKLF